MPALPQNGLTKRNASFTQGQIYALSPDYTIALNATRNVKMEANFFESNELCALSPCTAPWFLHWDEDRYLSEYYSSNTRTNNLG